MKLCRNYEDTLNYTHCPRFYSHYSDVIATVLELKDVVIATDDRRLRKVCKILGAKVTGTIGIIVDAVLHGPLTEEEGKELLKKLDYSGFQMNVALYEKALALMGGVKFN
ncbi:putative nucleic acid-binding protein, contains PIN domain [Methanophagales archaeon]|nr:putative nucleic acid-binding protein, contains PIN domain [Methanophagales archaeon]